MTVIDADQHLVEARGMWRDHIDPAFRDDALGIDDDSNGNAWLTWRDERLGLADVQTPGETDAIGERQARARRGEPPLVPYDDALPRDHWDPDARVARLDAMGVDDAMLFPNYGLLWERRLSGDLPALLANLRAWNRWCATVAANPRLLPVAHLSLRDLDWLDDELASLADAGVKTAMIAPAIVDGRPLSHPELDRARAAFVADDIAPVFHVADQPRVFDDAWYPPDGSDFVPVLDSVFLHTAAALACTDLIVHGTLERHPDLRIGIVELSAVWVPMFLMMLDGGYDFTTRLNGSVPAPLSMRPSEYFRRHVRVSSFSYELPEHLRGQLQGAELLMACSDFPHSEGTATPLPDYAATGRYGTDPDRSPGLFADNAAFLLGRASADMKPAPFTLHEPASVDAAVALLAADGDDAKVIAGGQSLTPMLALRLTRFDHLVDLGRIETLRGVTIDTDQVRVGAMTPQAVVERDPRVAAAVPLLARAIPHIGHRAIRTRGTIGGSLAHADPASELPAVALALDAQLTCVGPTGTRSIAARDFFLGTWTTALADDEMLTAITFPVARPGQGFALAEVARRHGDFALAGVAVALGLEHGSVSHATVALFGLAGCAIRSPAAEALLVGAATDGLDAARVGEAAMADATPSDDVHATATYRRAVGAHLVRQAVASAIGDARA